MKIYNASGAEILDIQVDDSSVRYRSIMNDDSLTLNFSTTGPVSVPRGSYVDFEGARYTLFYPENFKKNSTRDFEYTLILHGWREALKLYKYKDLSAKPYRLKFPLTARPVDFLQLLVDCMNLHDAGWSAGDYIEADEKLISFNHEYCFDVLGRLATEFNTEWEITGKTIHLRKVEKFKDAPLPLSYGMGNGFKTGVGRQNDGDRQPIGRLYVQGGERNIDYSEYGSSSLLLPKSASLVYEGKTYRTDADGMYITRDGNSNTAEDSYDGSDHYPKRVGIVSHVIVVDAAQHFYDIRDTSIPAALDYRDCRIPGEKATIVFQSGALAGREFDIEQTDTDLTGYIHAERRFKIVPAELDGQVMPGGVFVPQVGDKYAIFNISMPQAYISDNATKTGASWDMFREAVKYFAEEENDKFSFTGELDGVWSKSRWLEIGGKIVPGGHVLFSDPQFQPSGILIRITAVKDYVNKPHKPEITLSNAPISGSFSADLGKLEAEEVVREADKKEVIRFTKRQWRDAKETMSMLQEALLNFSGSINPITVQTMQLLVGDESLQFRFVNNKTNPSPVTHNVSFNPATKVLTVTSGIIQHMTLGITSLKKSHAANEYKYWDMSAYTSPALDADKAYYLYARCAKSGTTGVFLLSETAIGMESVANQYHFLLGVLNSEQDGDRSFAPLYGFTEILPGRVTTDRIVSQDGKTYFDLDTGEIGGKITFRSTSGQDQDMADWADGTSQDIQDAQAAAAAAALKAQQAIEDAEANVGLINTEIGKLQAQIDGEVSNWFYPYTPTLANYPASDWTTNEIKDRHIGDTFTNTSQAPATDAGKSWRFVKNGSVYSWTLIADSDAVKALLKAAEAQATADGKSTTFLIQPTKYHLGDMWVLNSDQTVNGIAYKEGDILTATQDSTTFVQAHWVKRVRYTDDTAIDNLEIGGRNYVRSFLSGLWKSFGGEGTIDNISQNVSRVYGTKTGGSSLSNCLVIPLKGDTTYTISANVITALNGWFLFREKNNTINDRSGQVAIHSVQNNGSGFDISEGYVEKTFTTKTETKSIILEFGSNTVITDFDVKIEDIVLVKGNKPTDWTPAPEDVQAEINDAKQEALTAAGNAQNTANSLKDFTDTAFRDGIIDRSESVAIEKYKNSLNEAMAKAEASYNKVYANTYLEGAAKTNLLNAKINLWGQRDTLLSAINTAIAGGTTTPAQKTAVDNAFATFNSLMSAFQNAIEDANKAIQVKLDAISKGYVDNLQIGGVNLLLDSEAKTWEKWATGASISSVVSKFGVNNWAVNTITDNTNPGFALYQSYPISDVTDTRWKDKDIILSATVLPWNTGRNIRIELIVEYVENGETKRNYYTGDYGTTIAGETLVLSVKKPAFPSNLADIGVTYIKVILRSTSTWGVGDTFRARGVYLGIGNKEVDWTPSPQDIATAIADAQSSANAAQSAVDDLDDYIGGAFKDGVIDAAEAKAIEKYINSVNEIMSKAEASYNKVYANTYLEGAAKTNLLNAKINLWGQRDTLLSAINTAISGGTTTPAQKTAVDNAFSSFNSLMSAFQNALEDANKAIQVKLDAISKGYVDNLQIGGVNLLPKSRGTELGDYANGGLYAMGGYGLSIYGGDSFMIASSGVPDPPDNQNNIRIATGKTLQLNETYTLSFEARTTSDQDRDHNVRLPYLGNNIVSIKTGENFQKYSVTFKITNENTVNGSNNYFFFWQQNQGIYITYLRKIKLEKGNKATDWSPSPEDVEAEIDAANAIAADALAKANTSKAITDKFGTTVDGGLISTVMMVLRELNSSYETAGISGIQGELRNNPAFWAGGTYAQAFALIQFLSKMSAGTTPGANEYANLAKITMLHNGAAKIGDFIIEESGRIVMVDPETGKPRLVFGVFNIPTVADLLSGTQLGQSVNTGSGAVTMTTPQMTLSGSVTVSQDNSTLTFGGTLMTITAFRGPGSGSAQANIEVLRNGILYTNIASVSVFVSSGESGYEEINTGVKVLTGVPTGTYTLRLRLTYIGDIIDASGMVGTSTLAWSFSKNVEYFQFGLDGMMLWHQHFHLHMSKDGGLDGRALPDKWNAPGVLLSATVGINGTFSNWWGAKKHATQTAVKNSTGRYTIYHSIGHEDYQVTASSTAANRSYHIVSQSAASFVIEWRSILGSQALTDTSFHIQVTGNNYNT
ncbi:hypothetical protein SAMN05216357_112132 [Porphyromonadaceae bacterium KH3CP3RA]|nr:hypothetical protein SAMN05216357_112132 [Porphyromonadaceae bacterium KH3CP3RA]